MRILKTRAVVTGALAALAVSAVMVVPTGAAIDSAVVVPTPNTAADQGNYLESVSCVSASFCVAVGTYSNGVDDQNLALVWNGSTWASQTTPNVWIQSNKLYGVSCVSASFCVAVGRFDAGSNFETSALHWDGSVWTVETTPNAFAGNDNFLRAVSCVSTSYCLAVGNGYDGASDQNLSMVWNGSDWTLQATPNSFGPGQDNGLYDVSCVSTSFCVAAGDGYDGTARRTTAMVWNGSTWMLQSTPNVGAGSNYLNGLSCVSTSFCVAVGEAMSGDYRTLAMVWDGSTWTLQSTPNVGTASNYVNHVSCHSTSLCVMVGEYADGSSGQTMAVAWDGSAWTLLATPNPGAGLENSLDAAACVSDRQCVAVGYFENGTAARTLAMALTGPEPDAGAPATIA
ncbi:MAG: hypothetical protein FJW77_04905 [Actinobacteria bacterium]|nr:hypothetical protein [Actinomycetota bacterium]